MSTAPVDGPTFDLEIHVPAGGNGHGVANPDRTLRVVGVKVEADVAGVQWGSFYSASCMFPNAPTKAINLHEVPSVLTRDTKPPAFFMYAGIPLLIFLHNPTDKDAKVTLHLHTQHHEDP